MSLAMDMEGRLPVYERSSRSEPPVQEEAVEKAPDKVPHKAASSGWVRRGLLFGGLAVVLVCLLDAISLGLRKFVFSGLPTSIDIFPEPLRPLSDLTFLVNVPTPRLQSYLHSLSVEGGGPTSCTLAFRDAVSGKPIETITHVTLDSPQVLAVPNLLAKDVPPTMLQFSLERTSFTPINNYMHDASQFHTASSELHAACSVRFTLLLFSFLPLPLHVLEVYRLSGSTPAASYTEFGLPIPGLKLGGIASSAQDGKTRLPSSEQQRRLKTADPNVPANDALKTSKGDTTVTFKLRDAARTLSADKTQSGNDQAGQSRPLVSNSSAVICNRDGASDNLPSFLTVCVGAALSSAALNLPFTVTLHAPALDLTVGQSAWESGAGDVESSGWRLSTQSFVLSLPPSPRGIASASGSDSVQFSTNLTLSCYGQEDSKEACTLLYPTSPLLTHMANGHAVMRTRFANTPNFISSLLGPQHVIDYSSFDGDLVSAAAALPQAPLRHLTAVKSNSTAVASNLFKCMRVLMDTWEFGDGCVNVNSLLFDVNLAIDSWYGRLITANVAAAWMVGTGETRLAYSSANFSFVDYLVASNNLSYSEAAGALNESAALWIQGEKCVHLKASSNWNRSQSRTQVLVPGTMQSTVAWYEETVSFGSGKWTWQESNATSSTLGSLDISAVESSAPILFGNGAAPRVSFSGLAFPNVTSVRQWAVMMQNMSLFVNIGSGTDIVAQAFLGADISPDGTVNKGIEADIQLDVNGNQIFVSSNKVEWDVPTDDQAFIAADSMGVIGEGSDSSSWEVEARVGFESLPAVVRAVDPPKNMKADFVLRTNKPKPYLYDWVGVFFSSNASSYSVDLKFALLAQDTYWNAYQNNPHAYNAALLETIQVLSYSNTSLTSFDFGLSGFQNSESYPSYASWYPSTGWNIGFQYTLNSFLTGRRDYFQNHGGSVTIYRLQVEINELFKMIETLKASIDAGKFLPQFVASLSSRGVFLQPHDSSGLEFKLTEAALQDHSGSGYYNYMQVQRKNNALHNVTLAATGAYSGTSWSQWLVNVNASSFRVNGVELAELSGNVSVDVGYSGYMTASAVESLRGQNNFVGEASVMWNMSNAYTGSALVHSTGLAPDRAAWLLDGNFTYSPTVGIAGASNLPTTFQATLMPRKWTAAFDLSGENIDAVYQYLNVVQPAQYSCRVGVQIYDPSSLKGYTSKQEAWVGVVKEALASLMSVPGTPLSARNFTRGNQDNLRFDRESVYLEFFIFNPSLQGSSWSQGSDASKENFGPSPLICVELQDHLTRRLSSQPFLLNDAIGLYANRSRLSLKLNGGLGGASYAALQNGQAVGGGGGYSWTVKVRIPDESVPFHVVGSSKGLFGGEPSARKWLLHVDESSVVAEGGALANITADLSMNLDTTGFIRVEGVDGVDPENIFITDTNVAWDLSNAMNGFISATSTSLLVDWDISTSIPVLAYNMSMGLQYFPHGASPQLPNLNLVAPVFSSPVVMQFRNFGASIEAAQKKKNNNNPVPTNPLPGAQVSNWYYQFGRQNTLLFDGVLYSTLSDVFIDSNGCCREQYGYAAIPPGWQLAMDSANVRKVISTYAWQTDRGVMVMSASGMGISYGTKNRNGGFYSDDGTIMTQSVGYNSFAVYKYYGQTLISLCPSGQYSDGKSLTCSSCPAGTYSPSPGANSMYSCMRCSPGTYSLPGASVCNVDCPAGTFGNNVTDGCSPCKRGTFSPLSGLTSQDSCFKCPSGKFSQSLGAADASVCLPCGPVGSGPEGATTCLGKANLVPLLGAYWSTLADVPLDDANSQNSCQNVPVSIPPGWQLAPSSKSVRLLVAAAHYWSTQSLVLGNGDVVDTKSMSSFIANAGRISGTSGLLQSGGRYQPQSCYKQILISTCDPGSYSNGSTIACIKCAAGKYSSILGATSASECLPCVTNSFSSAGASSCSYSSSSCPAGTYSSGSACVACSAGSYSSGIGSTSCLPCSQGYFASMPGASACLACTPSTPSGASSCFGQSCILQANKNNIYSTLGDVEVDTHTISCQSTPMPLPPGWGISPNTPSVINYVVTQHFWSTPSLLLANGQSISTKADNLVGGAVWGSGDLSQINGPPRLFSPWNCNSQILLQLCVPGYSNNNTDVECTRCLPGQFAPNFGSAACSACPPGLRSAAGASICSAACPWGTVASGADPACLPMQISHREASAERRLSDSRQLIHDKMARRRASTSTSTSNSITSANSSPTGSGTGLRDFIFDVSILEGAAYSSRQRNNYRGWYGSYTPTVNRLRQTMSACRSTSIFFGMSWATYQKHATDHDAVLQLLAASFFQDKFPDYVLESLDVTGDNEYLAVTLLYYDQQTYDYWSNCYQIDFLTTQQTVCEYADPARYQGWSCRVVLTDSLLDAVAARPAASGLLDLVAKPTAVYYNSYDYIQIPNKNYVSSNSNSNSIEDDSVSTDENALLLKATAVGTYLGESIQGPWVLTFANLSLLGGGGGASDFSQHSLPSVSTLVDGIDGSLTFRPQTNVSNGVFDLSSFKKDTYNTSFGAVWHRINDTTHMALQNRLDVHNKKVYDAGIHLAWQQPHVDPPVTVVLTQADILKEFYNAMGPSASILTNWDFAPQLNLSRALCASGRPSLAWAGVTCDLSTKRVTELRLSNLALAGQLPSSLAGLAPSLTLLDLSGNSLVGAIPPSLGSLTKLVSLNLGSNPSLAGSLGSSLCPLAQPPVNATVNIANTGVVCFHRCWLSIRLTDRFVRDASLPECSVRPTGQPTSQPSRQPTRQPTGQPTGQPIRRPTGQPSSQPSGQPVGRPSGKPTGKPTTQPTSSPTEAFFSCPPGHYYAPMVDPDGGVFMSCVGCPLNTMQPLGGLAESCVPCQPGEWAGNYASVCSKCPAGFYSLGYGSACKMCPTGTFSLAGASSCGACGSSKFAGPGASSCETCSA